MKITKEMPVYGIVVNAFIKEIEKLETMMNFTDRDGHLYSDDFYFGLGQGYLIIAPRNVYDEKDEATMTIGCLELILEDVDWDEMAGAIRRRRDEIDSVRVQEAKAKIDAFNKIKREKDEAFLDIVMERFGVLAA